MLDDQQLLLCDDIFMMIVTFFLLLFCGMRSTTDCIFLLSQIFHKIEVIGCCYVIWLAGFCFLFHVISTGMSVSLHYP